MVTKGTLYKGPPASNKLQPYKTIESEGLGMDLPSSLQNGLRGLGLRVRAPGFLL